MKKMLIFSALAGAGYLIWKNNQPKKRKNKSKKKGKSKSNKRSKKKSKIREAALPDYDLSNLKKLNKQEKYFAKYLKKIKADLPEGEVVKVKKREPVLMDNGYIEQAYIVRRENDITYIVTPEIYNNERLSFAVHEGCHLEDGHQDPKDIDYKKTPFEKELQVEKCVRGFFKKNKIPNKYKRSKREIKLAYQ